MKKHARTRNRPSKGSEVKLDTLGDQFDAMLSRMQTPKARVGMRAAFAASPEKLGRAAVAAARKRN